MTAFRVEPAQVPSGALALPLIGIWVSHVRLGRGGTGARDRSVAPAEAAP